MLTRDIAEPIVRETSLRLNRNINIMNHKGVIISSCDPSRVNDIHEGALEVLDSGKTLIINPNQKNIYKGTQPGVNLPIVFQDKMVGVIGITGNPAEIVELGELVKMTTELMLKQEYIASQLEWKQRTKEMVVEELLKDSPSYNHIERGLNLLNVQLEPPYTAFVVQMTKRSTPNNIIIEKLENEIGTQRGFAAFININRIYLISCGLTPLEAKEKGERFCSILKKLNITFRIAFSNPFHHVDKFSQSYTECDIALAISEDSRHLIPYADIESKALIYQIDKDKAEEFSQRVISKMISKNADILECFFNHNFNIQKTADALFIHRNTLIYRLKMIEEKTGYDPKDFKDALTLQLAIWIDRKSEKDISYKKLNRQT
ncbi:MAG TPA: sugar diacid recognition domain-containing protein [Chondromyces sp.]|nr:sugar diacid recognition domain-containing protein [Chondromyces sp.]